MAKTPLVSVVVPCYNLGQYLVDAVSSVKAQTFKDWELIVVDDGSTDDETKRAIQALQKDPQVTVLVQKNAGLPITKNNGTKLAKGKYIVSLDADDMLEPEYLAKTVAILEQDKEGKLGFVTTWLKEFGERTNLWKTGAYDIPALLEQNIIHAGSMFRKSVWEEVGGFKKMKIGGYEDWEFWVSVAEKGYKWERIEDPLFLYRIRGNSMLAGIKNVHVEIYEEIIDLHADFYRQNFRSLAIQGAETAFEFRRLINAKDELSANKDELIALYTPKVHELETLQSSRYVKLALKVKVVVSRIKDIIARTKHIVLKLIRAVVPGRIKKWKKSLFVNPPTTVSNTKWQSDAPLVSVISPFYNQADTIEETVKSVLAQTFKAFEYIIVDDGSKPDQAAALDAMKDPRLRIIHHKENKGKGSPAAARNSGIQEARGRYIVCLDSDDALAPTYLEKCLAALEASPHKALATTFVQNFGETEDITPKDPYNADQLIANNMVITAAMFRRDAWEKVGGYKEGIGYEDWELWINMAEHGLWGITISEPLFLYRVVPVSRFIHDRSKQLENIQVIAGLHPDYASRIAALGKDAHRNPTTVDLTSAFINLDNAADYRIENTMPRILIALPWMPFGGAETLILNFCNELKEHFFIDFVTGLPAENEWTYKFQEISENIYHLPNMFSDEAAYVEFISNYITTRDVELLHIIHTSFLFGDLPKLKQLHPKLKVLMTCFNDRAHFDESVTLAGIIDAYSTDNQAVAKHYHDDLPEGSDVTVIPNGIDSDRIVNPSLFNRSLERQSLGLAEDELGIFFIGRVSPEKNPDVFTEVAKQMKGNKNLKFISIGGGPMEEVLETAAKKLPNFTHLGYQAKPARYLSAADVFVLPSSIEGFPLSILEAMAMEVAVVASRVGAIPDVISQDENGMIVSPGDAGEIAEALSKLDNDRKLLTKIKKNARLDVEHKYSSKILGKHYQTLYSRLVK